MKNLLLFFILVFFLYSCKEQKNEITSAIFLELNDDLKEIVSKYINYQPCSDCIYEIYFDKVDPHYSNIILYKGIKSLTTDEYERNEKFPVMYTKILDKKIFMFSGSERYFRAPKKNPEISKGKEGNKPFNMWVISDSVNLYRVDTLEYAYPFLPLPVKRAFSPF